MESGRKVKEESLDLRKDSFKLTKEMKGRLSDTEVDSVNRFDDGVRILDDIDEVDEVIPESEKEEFEIDGFVKYGHITVIR